MVMSNVEEMFKKVKAVPTIPPVMQKILDSINNPHVGARHLGEVITADQSLTACVLKYVNSSYIGLRVKVNNIYNAVSMLGFSTIRQICLSVSICKKFKKLQNNTFISAPSFWRHSIATALLARNTSEGIVTDPSVSYTLGLIHDIGKLLFLEHYEERFLKVLTKVNRESIPLFEAEISEFGVSHADVGNWLLKKWKLPQNVRLAVKNHHSSNIDDITPVSEDALTGVIYFANQLAHHLGYSGSGNSSAPLEGDRLKKFYGTDLDGLGINIGNLENEVQTSINALGIDEPDQASLTKNSSGLILEKI